MGDNWQKIILCRFSTFPTSIAVDESMKKKSILLEGKKTNLVGYRCRQRFNRWCRIVFQMTGNLQISSNDSRG